MNLVIVDKKKVFVWICQGVNLNTRCSRSAPLRSPDLNPVCGSFVMWTEVIQSRSSKTELLCKQAEGCDREAARISKRRETAACLCVRGEVTHVQVHNKEQEKLRQSGSHNVQLSSLVWPSRSLFVLLLVISWNRGDWITPASSALPSSCRHIKKQTQSSASYYEKN